MLSIAVFASGAGSNFKAIHEAIQTGSLDARIALLLSNNSQSGAITYAIQHGIPTLHLSSKTVPDQEQFTFSMVRALETHEIDFIALAGYMKLVPAEVIRLFKHRITNIHPALLPLHGGPGMYGMHVHRAVIEAGEKESGATVHLVDEIYDHGMIVLQEKVPVFPADTPELLALRVLVVEHRLYPEALRLFSSDRVRIEGNQLSILPRKERL